MDDIIFWLMSVIRSFTKETIRIVKNRLPRFIFTLFHLISYLCSVQAILRAELSKVQHKENGLGRRETTGKPDDKSKRSAGRS